MRSIEELVNREDPGWPLVLEAVNDAQNHASILPTTRARGEAALLALQVTSRSPMGAVALESGGISVDRGWIRILGAGGPEMEGDIARWNGLGRQPPLAPPIEGALRVAFDALGGTFAINGGGLGADLGAKFYEGLRWQGWDEELAAADLDRGIHLWPPPWTTEGKSPADVSRKAIPMTELVALHEDMRGQLR